MTNQPNLARRHFIVGSAAALGGLAIGLRLLPYDNTGLQQSITANMPFVSLAHAVEHCLDARIPHTPR